jgi:hypothetical protein
MTENIHTKNANKSKNVALLYYLQQKALFRGSKPATTTTTAYTNISKNHYKSVYYVCTENSHKQPIQHNTQHQYNYHMQFWGEINRQTSNINHSKRK